ncbi:PEP-CTERM sorting domain-containing protein [Massilia sp. CF038]|uniref:PEP-CTERM sorting domain-containing protein n=1 Tax=Massilia sp. CF038 TaxID=1881045 RepID=UPI00091150F5|nr:PEP-CTERM sorting domain-containing protein [Massilia sp. CF038]SHH43908.1 PEP-CTERM protein-sorting domain-containing protein [Massilia sp. CF038]
MITIRALQAIVLASAMFSVAAGQAQATPVSGAIHMEAEYGNHVGYELDNGAASWRHGLDGTMYTSDNINWANDGVNMFFERGDQRWLMQFVAPLYDPRDGSDDGQMLQVGLYDNVNGDARYAPNQAGMAISSPLGSMVEWSGWFRVLDIAYGNDGNLSRFAVDFMQYDTWNQTGPALSGSLRYNSALPIKGVSVPEPGSVLLLLAGLGILAGARRRI